MKKVYFLLVLVATAFTSGAQCTVDPSARLTPGISPPPAQMPCVERNKLYEQIIQVKCPVSYDSSYTIPVINTQTNVTVTIDSMELTQVIGLPTGVTWFGNPGKLRGGQNGCMLFTGRATSAPGHYPLEWYGTVWGSLALGLGKETYTGSLNQLPAFDYYLTVVAQGQGCAQTGIDDINNDLDNSWALYPNPSNGSFECKLTKGMAGEIQITDITGRVVYAQHIDEAAAIAHIDLSTYAKGMYIAHLRTADGSIAKTISIE